jgi:oxygen-independent coproporphyrinogen III oxidase
MAQLSQQFTPNITIVPETLARYQGNGPRYTSYPTADRFHDRFVEADYRAALADPARDPSQGWSLYVHVPFCDTLCFYCACNKIATKNYARAEAYVGYLGRELALLARATPGRRVLSQLHFGGGTPTFLRPAEWRTLLADIRRYFLLAPDAECSVEIDPRRVTAETLDCLFDLGINRISVGVQDFDPDVQRAVNRLQSIEQTTLVIEQARARGCA